LKRSLRNGKWLLARNIEKSPLAFDDGVAARMENLSPAERHVAQFFVEQKQKVVLSSAAEIAALTRSSDATVVRTAKSLGFAGLPELREVLLASLMGTSPGDRLAHTLAKVSEDRGGALRHIVSIHEDILQRLKTQDMANRLARAVDILGKAPRRHVFGIGPSGAVAGYAALQFNRLGLPTYQLSAPGIGLADGLIGMQPGDAMLMMAYGPLYREASVALDEAQRLSVPVVLVSDDLGPIVRDQVAEVLPLPRGRSDHLAMHAGTMVLIEAMTISLAALAGDAAIDSLDRLSTLRGAIDKTWLRRGTRKNISKSKN
jgi:DNA-binding MurR/RpiR family transcriptional regulator